MSIKGCLILDFPASGVENMAKDESLFLAAKDDKKFPVTLRIYSWDRPTISLGRRQSFNQVDVAACKAEGVDVVKRFGGGAAVYHHQEITYSFTARLNSIPLPPADKWRELFLSFYKKLGLEADAISGNGHGVAVGSCFSQAEVDEPTINGKKIIGSARRKSRTVFFQHGSILLESQPELLERLVDSADADSSAGILELAPHLNREEVVEAFTGSVCQAFDIRFSPLLSASSADR